MSPVGFALAVLLASVQGSALAQAQDDPAQAATVSWTVAPVDGFQKDGRAALTLHGTVATGWHLYSLKQLPEGPTPLLVTVAANDAVKAEAAPTGSPPTKVLDTAFGLETQFYSGQFTLTVPVRLKSREDTPQAIPVDVRFQTCNGRICQPPKTMRLSAAVNQQTAAKK